MREDLQRHLPTMLGLLTALSVISALALADSGAARASILLVLSVLAASLVVVVHLERERRGHVEARRRAERATAAKSEFLAHMSHEIRTPLGAILGYADLMLDGDLPEHEIDEGLRSIRRNGDHLLELIDDILDVSKIEAGCLPIHTRPVSPREVVDQVVGLFRESAAVKGIALESGVEEDVPARIETDPTRLRQILTNLIGNAIKFTDRGSVAVAISVVDEWLRIEVADTGVGIPSVDIDRVFEPFAQAEGPDGRTSGGAGLGLAITSELCRLLGGSIRAESKPGTGTRFIATIELRPVEIETPESQNALGTSREGSGRILYVEDDRDSRRLGNALLRKAGYEVDVAPDGQTGYEMSMEALTQGEPYDVVLMDMQMPVLDGYEATRNLRRDGYPGVVVALTAHAMAGDRERCEESGCDDYLTKPIDREALFALIARHVAARSS